MMVMMMVMMVMVDRACLQVTGGGLWTLMHDRDLVVIPRPTFTPTVGLAGTSPCFMFTIL